MQGLHLQAKALALRKLWWRTETPLPGIRSAWQENWQQWVPAKTTLVELGISPSDMESRLPSQAPKFCKVIHYHKSLLLKLVKVGPAVQFRAGIPLLGNHLSREHYSVFKQDLKCLNSQGGEGLFAGKGVSGRVGGPGSRSQPNSSQQIHFKFGVPVFQ